MKREPDVYTTRSASEVAEGDLVPSMTQPITYAMVVMSAAATWTFFAGHIDTAYAQLQGRRGIYMATGPINGLVDRYVTQWAGPLAFVRRRRTTMRESICADDTVTFDGRIERITIEPSRIGPEGSDATVVELSVSVRNQHGDTCVVSSVSIELPQPKAGVNA